ncbi:PREDICTED: uncharacterized protein LOC109359436 isoform X2 [Lupinus angustifolius]|uniref:uncharacterized protein LOC109359436 isoform X2 n=1 Tax=Lupinus angustifolius TaxID=3871 RepID=UPI00092E385A|nr:PREDICTED: uncharacterized protein LOC109359436 isoform X2 [Lupinus angustifolius]XP_019459647.1 PREDICTED: uncharacterized protein LOC109359436 isoform X2 [Lupinus angustifolius]
MAQSLVYGVRVPELSRIVSSAKRVTRKQPRLPNHVAITAAPKSEPSKLKIESSECRVPLSQVVSDCTKRWFQDTLNEAKAGDSAMQLLLADMYFNGYGVPIDPQKGTEQVIQIHINWRKKLILRANSSP